MQRVTVDVAAEKILGYLKNGLNRPFFVLAEGGAEFLRLKNLFQTRLEPVSAVEFCGENSFLDIDGLLRKLSRLSRDALGLGFSEAAFLSGDNRILSILHERRLPKRMVVLCRSCGSMLSSLAIDDVKFRNYFCRVETGGSFSVVRYDPSLRVNTDAQNFLELLNLIETGRDGKITIKTNLQLKNVKFISTSYAVVKLRDQQLNVPEKALEERQWSEILSGKTFEYWRSYCEGWLNIFDSAYLEYAFAQSANYDEYERNVYFALLQLDKNDARFGEYYQARKKLLKGTRPKYLSAYIESALSKGRDAIYYLTSNSAAECKAMVKALRGSEQIPPVLLQNCSELAWYLSEYDFGEDFVTEYFRRYKELKLTGARDGNFKEKVEELARRRIYNELETRQSELDKIDGSAKLYWLDALGVEYLGYIQKFAAARGMSVEIKITRAELPTLTRLNRNFYDDWRGEKFPKNSKLDELIHAAAANCAEVIIDELKILREVLLEIAEALNDGEHVILTSDHGSSRLAVTHRGEIWQSGNPGEHSGRCCLAGENDAEKPPCATAENGYWVMANYDRFQGGKLAGAEVHGGATLEEVLVPVVEFFAER